MFKKYSIISLIIFILFFVLRVYVHSEHVKVSYAHQNLLEKLEKQKKKKLNVIALLHELQSSPFIKKDVMQILNFIPLQLNQIFSLSANEPHI